MSIRACPHCGRWLLALAAAMVAFAVIVAAATVALLPVMVEITKIEARLNDLESGIAKNEALLVQLRIKMDR